ncbi:hypothetical protein [Pseudomonas fluorescens]|uniref:O-linked N-acetylglucosamine transferase family protein n=1 Tax=Pseudomonas fluorescens TaxID=294 RepID=UPI001783D1B7|nr:hypothetical protein [Pseudomonas fluorescens]
MRAWDSRHKQSKFFAAPPDRLRPLTKTIDRIGAGLPETGLVFCSFNQLLKLNPAQLDLWCRLLCETPGSLLWMVDPDSEDARANLSREIEQRGVSLERLIFAPRLKQDEHLARLALADIALDSFPYTSHTTASDALWVGVPLLTRIGTTFVSRVAASLLHAHGFDELVAEDDEEYFEKVRALVLSPDRRADLRQRLESARLNSPLFDTPRFTKNLEALFIAMWEQHGRDTGSREPIIIQNLGGNPYPSNLQSSRLSRNMSLACSPVASRGFYRGSPQNSEFKALQGMPNAVTARFLTRTKGRPDANLYLDWTLVAAYDPLLNATATKQWN